MRYPLAPLAALVFFGCAASRPAAAPPRPAAGATPPNATVGELLNAVESAYREGRYDEGLALVKRTLELGSRSLSVIDRVGSIYHVLGRYGEAIAMWERGLRLESDPRRRLALERTLALARRNLGMPEQRALPEPRPPARRGRPAPPTAGLADTLYDEGIAYYARGEYLQATSSFMRVLEVDPGHQLARRALARLRLKPVSRDGDPG